MALFVGEFDDVGGEGVFFEVLFELGEQVGLGEELRGALLDFGDQFGRLIFEGVVEVFDEGVEVEKLIVR